MFKLRVALPVENQRSHGQDLVMVFFFLASKIDDGEGILGIALNSYKSASKYVYIIFRCGIMVIKKEAE
jgi:hypothetical protein